MMKKLFFFLLFFSFTTTTFAQKTAEDYLGTWFMFVNNSKVADKVSLHTLAHFRVYEPVSNFQHLLLRFGVNYSITKYASAGIGYDYMRNESFDKDIFHIKRNDHRIFEQFIIKNKINRVKFNHRYRLEHRWIQTVDGSTDFSNRIRYRLMLTIPLNNPELTDKTLFLNMNDEVHLLFKENPFQQNWLYLALGYKVNKMLSFQVGYQTIHQSNFKQFDRLMLGVFINTDFRKKSVE